MLVGTPKMTRRASTILFRTSVYLISFFLSLIPWRRYVQFKRNKEIIETREDEIVNTFLNNGFKNKSHSFLVRWSVGRRCAKARTYRYTLVRRLPNEWWIEEQKKKIKNFTGLSVGQTAVQFVFYFGYGESLVHLKYFIRRFFYFLARFPNGNQISKRYALRMYTACTRAVRNDLSTKMRNVIFRIRTWAHITLYTTQSVAYIAIIICKWTAAGWIYTTRFSDVARNMPIDTRLCEHCSSIYVYISGLTNARRKLYIRTKRTMHYSYMYEYALYTTYPS
jgi:hypothetical protein